MSVLDALSATADLPQRRIAEQTGLNLAKVNFLLQRLKEKGYVKLKRVRDNPHKKKYLYLLTPDGLAEKSRLTLRFLKRSLAQYDHAAAILEESVSAMVVAGVRRVILWGDNEITRLFLRLVAERGLDLHITGVVDPLDRNLRTLRPGSIGSLAADAVVICDEDLDRLPPDLPLRVWRLV